jgi:hypothetical protein
MSIALQNAHFTGVAVSTRLNAEQRVDKLTITNLGSRFLDHIVGSRSPHESKCRLRKAGDFFFLTSYVSCTETYCN